MDANGLRFWLLADDRDWNRPAPEGEPPPVTYDAARRTLRLASRHVGGPFDADGLPALFAEDEAGAAARLDVIAQSRDAYGTRAHWDADLGSVVAAGAVTGETPLFTPPPGIEPSDVALGHDGVLYLAFGDRVVLVDARERWQPFELFTPGIDALRLAAAPDGGVWVLDRAARAIARLRGTPPHDRPATPFASSTFRPCPEDTDPPRIARTLADAWPADEDGVAIACAPDGRIAVLAWRDPGAAVLHVYDPATLRRTSLVLAGVRRPYSSAFLDDARIAVLLAGVAEAVVFPLADATTRALPAGDFFPLRDHDGGPLVHGVALPPHYSVTTDEATLPLHRLSKPAFARTGEAGNMMLLDSANVGTVWHRLYLEAAIPPGCAVTARVAASDDPAAPMDDALWYDHRFGGGGPPQSANAALPRGAWLQEASELPFQPGMLACPRERDRSGLFTVLVQRGPSPGEPAGRAVRALRGRYLWVRLILDGTGAATPEVAALRAYGGRFSYRDQYLPELYRESVFGDDADARGRSTQADFLERFLDNFEGVLTTLEDRVAHAYLATDAATAPDDALEWLGSWIGFALDPAYPPHRRRALLRAAPELFRWRGTVEGVTRALELVTDGGVSGGEIVVVEDFRLRRTFATILGADLSNERDPLLGGLSNSGNSFVGDTLFLGDETRKEFIALFDADLQVTESERAAVAAFFDRLAHRVTVLVHQALEPQDFGLIRRVLELEAPAHLETRVERASEALLVGVWSLVGVDTYLVPKPPRGAVRVGRSRLGHRDFLQRPPSLDPRLEGDVP